MGVCSFVTVSRASLKMALRENGAQSFKRPTRSAKAALVHSEELLKLCDKLPKVPKRVCNLSFTFCDVVLSFNFAEIQMIVNQLQNFVACVQPPGCTQANLTSFIQALT